MSESAPDISRSWRVDESLRMLGDMRVPSLCSKYRQDRRPIATVACRSANASPSRVQSRGGEATDARTTSGQDNISCVSGLGGRPDVFVSESSWANARAPIL